MQHDLLGRTAKRCPARRSAWSGRSSSLGGRLSGSLPVRTACDHGVQEVPACLRFLPVVPVQVWGVKGVGGEEMLHPHSGISGRERVLLSALKLVSKETPAMVYPPLYLKRLFSAEAELALRLGYPVYCWYKQPCVCCLFMKLPWMPWLSVSIRWNMTRLWLSPGQQQAQHFYRHFAVETKSNLH